MTDTAPVAGESNDAQDIRKQIAALLVRITACDAVPLPDGDPVRITIMNSLADARAKLNDVAPQSLPEPHHADPGKAEKGANKSRREARCRDGNAEEGQ